MEFKQNKMKTKEKTWQSFTLTSKKHDPNLEKEFSTLYIGNAGLYKIKKSIKNESTLKKRENI